MSAPHEEQKTEPNLARYSYHWLHIPSGTRGTRPSEAITVRTLHTLLNRWNRQLPGVWQYWTHFE